MGKKSKNSNAAPEDFFRGGGEMGERMRAADWSQTPLGSPETWSQSLKTSVDICLNSRFPMVIWWGRDLVLLYNDGWRPILGANKDKIALGNRGRVVWAEIWDVLGPMFAQVLDTGEATWNDDGLLLVNRYGFVEEAYFTWSYSPIRDDDGRVGGVFTAVTETTGRVVGERRLKTSRDLGERSLAEGKTAEEACRAAAETLADNPFDIPFALIYLLGADGKRARLAEAVRLDINSKPAPAKIEMNGDADADIWNFRHVLGTNKGETIENLEEKFGGLPAGAWIDDATRKAFVLPLAKSGVQESPAGFLVCGISPRLDFDEDYRGFLELAGGHIATAIANARALEEERKRAASLAELDRAKTEFFSNVSHEFRTPLTLMLGNLEEVLAKDGQLPDAEKERIETAHRNSLRLLKLVNTLLDFSRIEAGRQQVAFEPTDLSEFTSELAGNFRSAIEKAGMILTVDCPPLSQKIAVDREMWEKIVLNLLANAFKYTFEGKIAVSLKENEESAELRVTDTGAGIPETELPHIFERFHRVRATPGRTHEGTGIGLALVKELVKIHGGEISVESEIGNGSTFTVSVPKERSGEESSEERIEKTSASLKTFEKSPDGWQSYLLDSESGGESESKFISPSQLLPFYTSAKILLADDNADMREYVRRLLEQSGYTVVAVADGQAALEFLEQNTPDLILTDVMMPRLDGFGLLEEIRRNERTREIPVIMLSARAGEESKIEGLEAGADDYLIKPFAAKELIARIESNLKLNRLRRESKKQVTDILESIKDCFVALDNDWRFIYFNRCAEDYFRKTREEVLGKTIWEVFPSAADSIFGEKYREAVEKQEIVRFEAPSLIKKDGWVEVDVYPSASGLSIYFRDISERKLSEEKLRRSENQMRLVTDSVPALISYVDAEHRYRFVNQTYTDWFGHAPGEIVGKHVSEVLGEAAYAEVLPAIKRVLSGEAFSFERLLPYKDGGSRFVSVNYVPDKDAKGTVKGYYALVQDTTERKWTEIKLREREAELKEAQRVGSIGSWSWNAETDETIGSDELLRIYGFDPKTDSMPNFADQNGLLYPHESWQQINEAVQNSLAPGEGYELDVPAFRNGGEPIWITARGEVVRDSTGKIIGLRGTVQDITARKQAEEVLAVTANLLTVERERLALALRTGALGVYEWRVGENSIWWSPETYPVFGVESDSFTPTVETFNALIHEDDREEMWRKTDECIKRRDVFTHEYRIVRRDGRIRWIFNQSHIGLNSNGNVERITGIAVDITERKRAEANLGFLAEVSEDLTRLSNDREIMRLAAEKIVKHLDLSRCIFTEYDQAQSEATVVFDWSKEPTKNSLVGTYRLSDFVADDFIQEIASGRQIVVNDTATDSRTSANRERFAQLEIGATVNSPYLSDGRWKASLTVHYPAARKWRRDELDLLGELSNRVWTRVERARAEEALQKSEAEFRTLANAVPQIVWVADREGKIEYVNDVWTEFSGLNAEKTATPEVAEVIHPDDREAVFGEWAKAFESGTAYELEARMRNHKTVEYRWFLMRSEPNEDESGKVVKWFGTSTDITAGKQAELRLRESEEKFRDLANSISQFAWMADASGSIFWYNERWFDYTGTSLEEMRGWGWRAVHHPDHVEPVTEKFKRHIASGEVWEDTFPLRSRTGEYRWFLSRALPIRDEKGQIVRWFGTNTDIDEQRRLDLRNRFIIRIDEAVRPLETPEEITLALARLLGEHLGVDRCAYAEVEADEDHFYIPGDYTRGDTDSIVGHYSMADFGSEVLRLMRENKPYIVHDVNNDPQVTKSDLVAYRLTSIQSVICVPLHKNNRFSACMAVHQKTPRRWLAEEVELVTFVANRFWESIERARIIKSLHESLSREQELRLEAEAANRLKDEFLATVSHELRTPLNAILGWSDMLQAGKATGEIFNRAVGTIYRSAKSQAQLIEDLLDVSRIITGKTKLDLRPVRFAAVVESAVNTLRPAADAKSIEIIANLDSDLSLVNGDEQRLQQIVWNLISNAVKFTPAGGEVEVCLENENSRARLKISDTGKGIEAEFLPFMFQRFRQEDASSTRRHGGLGLGLAIVRHLVELHGGTIRAASAGADCGSTFTVELPLISLDAELKSGAKPNLRESLSDGFSRKKSAPQRLSGVKVLLVDDEQSTLEILEFALSETGAEVRAAGSAAEAFKILQNWQPDVLVSDIAMPGEDGYSLIEKVRGLAPEAGGAIPAIAMTAYVRVEDRLRVLASGFQMYVPKPAESGELVTAIVNLIGEKRSL